MDSRLPSPKRPTRLLFWDIDGTLLVTGRAGMIAWEQAFAAERGGEPFPSLRTDGLTDHQIAAWLVGHTVLGDTPDEDVQSSAARLVSRYEAALVPALPLRQGRVLDNVAAVLEMVSRRSHLLSWLVTGNTAAGGAAKLRHYGLARYFARQREAASAPEMAALAGAFSRRVEPRANVARQALTMARAEVPDLDPSEVLLIGDTPHDVEGGHAIGVPVLAVASHTHSLAELSAHHPWQAVPALPAPDAFAAILAMSS